MTTYDKALIRELNRELADRDMEIQALQKQLLRMAVDSCSASEARPVSRVVPSWHVVAHLHNGLSFRVEGDYPTSEEAMNRARDLISVDRRYRWERSPEGGVYATDSIVALIPTFDNQISPKEGPA